MQFLKGLFAPTVEKGLTQDDVLRILGAGSKDKSPFPKLSDKQKEQIVTNNAIVYACVTTLAKAFAQAPLVVEAYDPAEDKWRIQDDSPLLDPFTKNPNISENDFKQYAQLHIQPTGKSYLWKWRSEDSVTRELWPVPPHWVTPNLVEVVEDDPHKPRLIESFGIKSDDGNEWTVPVEDMVYTKFPHPSNLWDGLAPMDAATKSIYLDQRADDYKAEAVTSLATPGLVIKTRKAMSPQQKSDLRAALRRKTGVDPRSNAFMISGDDASIDFINPMGDFNWASYSNLNETRICMCFGVPPIVIGSLVGLENSPWSNTGEAKKWMYSNTLVGLWESFASSYTTQLLDPKTRGVFRYAFDLRDVKELQENQDAVADRVGKLFDRGVITRAEAREAIGEDVTDDDNVFKYTAATMLVPSDESDIMDGGVLPDEEPEELPLETQLETGETI